MVCGVSSTCMSMCLCPMEARRESPETGVTEHCKLLCGCQEVGPLELPLSTVPSLQTLAPHFWKQYHYLSIAGLKLNCVIALASNSQKSTSFCLLSAEIKSMYHHTWQQPHFVGGNTGSREKKKVNSNSAQLCFLLQHGRTELPEFTYTLRPNQVSSTQIHSPRLIATD